MYAIIGLPKKGKKKGTATEFGHTILHKTKSQGDALRHLEANKHIYAKHHTDIYARKLEGLKESTKPANWSGWLATDRVSHKLKQKHWNKKMDAAQVSLGKKYAKETGMTKKVNEAKKYLGDPAHAGGYISALRGNQPFNNPHKKGSSKAKRWFKGLITAKLKKTVKAKKAKK
jgi:hypothetical protein